MLSPVELYPAVHAWLQAVGAVPHAAGVASVAQVVTALVDRLRSSAGLVSMRGNATDACGAS